MRLLKVTDTEKKAKKLSGSLIKKRRGPLIVGLVGDLGVGKTLFVQSFLRALRVKSKIKSPTFVIMKEYKLVTSSKTDGINRMNRPNKAYTKAYHIDAYRISSLSDLNTFGFKEILKEKNAVILIEWADKIRALLPLDTVWIKFEHGEKENERVISYWG